MNLAYDVIALPYMAKYLKAYWAFDIMLDAGLNLSTANSLGENALMMLLAAGPCSKEPEHSTHIAVVKRMLNHPDCNAHQISNAQIYPLRMAFNGWPQDIIGQLIHMTDIPALYQCLKQKDPAHNGFIFDLLMWGSADDINTCVNAMNQDQMMVCDKELDFERLKKDPSYPSLTSLSIEEFSDLWLAKEERLILEQTVGHPVLPNELHRLSKKKVL